MKNILFLLLSFSFCSELIAQTCRHTSDKFRCVKYLKNYDGDTVTVSIPKVHSFFGQEISVRLYGLDAPEMKTANECEKRLAIIARDYVQSRLLRAKRKGIELRNIQRDKYFRILAEIWVNGFSLSRALLKNNLAVEYYGETKPNVDWCSMEAKLPSFLLD